MSKLTPPQPPPTWTHTPEQLTALINELIAKDREFWDKIGALPAEECNFESVRFLLSEIVVSEGNTELSSNPVRSLLSSLTTPL